MILGILFFSCNHPKNDRSTKAEIDLIYQSLIECDSIIDKDYVIFRLSSNDFNIVNRNDTFLIGFFGKLYKHKYRDYFLYSDISFFNEQINSNDDYDFKNLLFAKFMVIDSIPLKGNEVDFDYIKPKYSGIQLLTKPFLNRNKNRSIIAIKKYCEISDCMETLIILIDKINNKWTISKIIKK